MTGRYPYRIIKAKWSSTGKRLSFQATVHISGTDELGIVSDISNIVSKDVGVRIGSMSVNSENGVFEGTLRIFVHDLEHLNFLIQKLSSVKGVVTVSRGEV
jgi:GTP pyrophosphokinase